METSETIVEIAKALSKFQSEVVNPKKNGDNPHFGSKFATLDEIISTIRPTLTKYGLSFMQPTKTDGSLVGVSTLILHESGEFLQSDFIWIPIPKTNAQGVGAAITYGRRFSIGATLGIATEEDTDGNEISGQNKGGQHNSQPQNKPQQNNNNTPDGISEGQVKAVQVNLSNLSKAVNASKEKLIERLEKEVGKFGSVTGMTKGQATKSITLLKEWIAKTEHQGG